jgi:hypothetical protein
MLAAAMLPPLHDIARETMGVGEAPTALRVSPADERK